MDRVKGSPALGTRDPIKWKRPTNRRSIIRYKIQTRCFQRRVTKEFKGLVQRASSTDKFSVLPAMITYWLGSAHGLGVGRFGCSNKSPIPLPSERIFRFFSSRGSGKGRRVQTTPNRHESVRTSTSRGVWVGEVQKWDEASVRHSTSQSSIPKSFSPFYPLHRHPQST